MKTEQYRAIAIPRILQDLAIATMKRDTEL